MIRAFPFALFCGYSCFPLTIVSSSSVAGQHQIEKQDWPQKGAKSAKKARNALTLALSDWKELNGRKEKDISLSFLRLLRFFAAIHAFL